jgi:flagellar hook-length control protein FliK
MPPTADWLPRVVTTTPAAQGGMRPVDEHKLGFTLATVAESPSLGQGDWLPSAGTAGNATSTAPSSPSLPSAPVDVRTPSWQEAFASRVQMLVDQQAGEARIRLNPPELGSVDVTISLVDDKTYVQLTTATVAARDELAQSLPRLRELLTVSGLDVGGASVQNGRDHYPNGGSYGTPDSESRLVSAFAAPGDEPEIVSPLRSQSRIDLFA